MDDEVVREAIALASELRRAESRETLIQLLCLRFGEVPDWARARIEVSDSGQLARWFKQLAQAETLEQALAD
jgi:hypothetical protein